MNAKDFAVGGVPVASLASRVGTPFYVYDGGIAEKKFAMLSQALDGCQILYSLKCNPNIAICSLLQSLGAGADIASHGEHLVAQEAGHSPDNTIFVGPGKRDNELEYAIDAGIYAFAAESANELQRIDRIARAKSKPVRVIVRVNTNECIEASPEQMVGGPSRFGIDEECVVETLSGLNLKATTILGIHTYAASQVLDYREIVRHVEHTLKLATQYSEQLGFELQCVDLGGGFGVPYAEDEHELNLPAMSAGIEALLAKYKIDRQRMRLVFESGRYLAAECGVFVTKVLDVKRSRGKTFVITDGGINHFLRPQFMKLNHPVMILNKHKESATASVSVGGPCCTPLDCVAADVLLAEPETGDLVGFFNCGAYGFSMSMLNFLSHPWPPEVFVHKAKPTSRASARTPTPCYANSSARSQTPFVSSFPFQCIYSRGVAYSRSTPAQARKQRSLPSYTAIEPLLAPFFASYPTIWARKTHQQTP